MRLFFVCAFLASVEFGWIFCGHLKTPNKSKNTTITTKYLARQNQDVYVNVKIHIDKVLSDNYTAQYGRKSRSKLKFLTKKLIEEVEQIYKELRADEKILRFKLIQTKFLKNNTIQMDENGTKYLRSYCDWQAKKKSDKGWYYSVLLTGLDLYYDIGGTAMRQSHGRSYLNGLCNFKYSCTILEFHPDLMSFQLAHELAHSLGIHHDGPPNKCAPKGYVMAAKFTVGNHSTTWSECSRNDLKKYLKSTKSKCLRPAAKNFH